MQWEGQHVTQFRYSRPVNLNPLTVRLQPRVDYRQRLLAFALEFEPAAEKVWPAIDLEGNLTSIAAFREPVRELVVKSSFAAETENVNPYDFLLLPVGLKVPLDSPAREPLRRAYSAAAQATGRIADLSYQIARSADFATLEFLSQLCSWIHRQHETIVRPLGHPWPPEQTLREARGACRDLAVLMIEACRVQNIPSRFVSGYSAAGAPERAELHAWVEVYLPGAGWRGYDPSLGLAVTEAHLGVAAGAASATAAPTEGTFRGNALGTLEAVIDLRVSAAASL
jgi:transglutaminase-like putative cysteine protease